MDLWNLANQKRDIHRFSTLIAADTVRKQMGDPASVAKAIEWCKATAITKVYIESFRNGVTADRETLVRARDAFREAGIEALGCVTTTKVGKVSTRWNLISCFTDPATQDHLREILSEAAGIFDEIMIDDFWFTDCACPDCNAARERREVRVGGRTFAVAGDAWWQYRCELMTQISRECVLAPAKAANPNVKVIIKYPQWYDRFHLRGYDIARESVDFDRTWAGTETRDYPGPFAGNVPQYEAYFVMRWISSFEPGKCGGGWYDPYGTTERTYVEQARQTILGGARESLLFAYGSLQQKTGPRNVEVWREHVPEFFDVAAEVARREPIGVAAYKPANSQHLKEPFVFDFLGMIGIPLVPCHEFPTDAPAAFFSTHALGDAQLVPQLSRYVSHVRPILMTDGLFERLPMQVDLEQYHIRHIPIGADLASLLALPQEQLDAIREPLLAPFGLKLKAPANVAFYPFADGSWVLENFNDADVAVELNGECLALPARGWAQRWE